MSSRRRHYVRTGDELHHSTLKVLMNTVCTLHGVSRLIARHSMSPRSGDARSSHPDQSRVNILVTYKMKEDRERVR